MSRLSFFCKRLVRMATAPVPQPVGTVDEGYVCERAVRLGAMARQHNVKLLIETHGVWSDSEKLARLLSCIGSDNVGALWDVHHPYRFMVREKQSLEDVFLALTSAGASDKPVATAKEGGAA